MSTTTTNVPLIPMREPVVDDQGMLTFAWSQWFLQLFARIGGAIAPPNTQITTNTTSLSGVNATLTSLQTQITSLQNQAAGLTKGRDL